jgi:hypothetical protein
MAQYYQNLSGTRSNYVDGNLSVQADSQGPITLAVGTAEKGPSFVTRRVLSHADAMRIYGENTELSSAVLSGEATANTGLRVHRIGGKQNHHFIKQVISGTKEQQTLLRISPATRSAAADAEMTRYRIALLPFKDGNIYRQRVLIIDFGLEQDLAVGRIVYDSELLFSEDLSGFDVEINVDSNADDMLLTPRLFSHIVFNGNDLVAFPDLADFVDREDFDLSNQNKDKLPKLGDAFDLALIFRAKTPDPFDANFDERKPLNDAGAAPYFSSDVIEGSAGSSMNHCERYAQLEMVYEDLEYTDVDFLVPEAAYVDVDPVSMDSLTPANAKNYGQEALGYLWKYIYNGKPYMFMFGYQAPFGAGRAQGLQHALAVGGVDVNFTASAAALELGDLLNLVELHFHDGADAVEAFPNEKGLIELHITYTSGAANQTLQTPFGAVEIPGLAALDGKIGRLRLSKHDGSMALSDALADDPASYNTDPFVMSHYELTGEIVPEAVLERLFTFDQSAKDGAAAFADPSLVALNAEVREINLAHQAAQAAYKSSTNYSETLAFAQTMRPSSSRNGFEMWAGQPPVVSSNSAGEYVIDAGDEGSGIMGNKLMFGSSSYRSGRAFGGFFCTTGVNLPNQVPYGIDDSDELIDQYGKAVDIGKHLVICSAYGTKIERGITATGRARRKVKNLALELASLIAGLPVDQEPIGPVNGDMSGVGVSPLNFRIPQATLNSLAMGRLVTLDQTGSIPTIRTAALPYSDYTRISTIRAANEILSQIRAFALPLLGRNYRNAKDSLNTQITGYLRAAGQAGVIQPSSGSARILQSREDEIAGRMRIVVTFTPPFALEQITVDLTVAPPA